MILDNLNLESAKHEIELLREVIKAKDALIAELSKRPVVQPVYVPYPSYPTWEPCVPSYPWKYSQPYVTTTSTTTGISISTDGKVRHYKDGKEIT